MASAADHVIRLEDLPRGTISWTFNGHQHGTQMSFFVTEGHDGAGPRLHTHPYEETFIVQEGEALFTVGDDTLIAGAGDILVVPAGTPHKFVCRGDGHRQLSIHSAPRMETEWLE